MRVTCDICGAGFRAQHARPHGNHCVTCAEWLRALKKGPYQEHPDANYEKLGVVIGHLLKGGELRERDFIRGLVKGIKKS